MEFIGGAETALARRGYGLLMRVVPDVSAELEVYRRWRAARQVDGVVLADLSVGDPRVSLVQELRLPAVVAGPPAVAGQLPCVWTNDGAAVEEAMRYLAALGHRRIARVGGPVHLAHSQVRQRAFDEAATSLGVEAHTWSADYSADQVRSATREILLSTPRPTAIVYDDDLGAVTGPAEARELNLSVPLEVSLLAWDDSQLCQVTFPQLSAMSHDVPGYGAHVIDRLLDVLDGATPAAHLDSTPRIRPRASTAPPPHTGTPSAADLGAAPPS